MQNSSKSVPSKNALCGWLGTRPLKLGKLTMKKNCMGTILLSCLTPTLNGMDVSILPIVDLTILFLYILVISDRRFGEKSYLPRVQFTSLWLDLSKKIDKICKENPHW